MQARAGCKVVLCAVVASWALIAARRSVGQEREIPATNLELAGELLRPPEGPPNFERWALLEIIEPMQGGKDLNGDGDAEDMLLYAHDLQTGTTTPFHHIPIPMGEICRPLALGRWVAFFVGEEGGGDLNGDGDARDQILHVHDLETGRTANLGLAGVYSQTGDGDGAGHFCLHLRGTETWIVFFVSERAQGDRDLNGDGDAEDLVVHVHDLEAAQTRNLALAGDGFSYGFLGHRIGFPVWEADQGSQDLNGDGDAEDQVFHVHDLESGVTTNLALASSSRFSGSLQDPGERWVAFQVTEAGQRGRDLNGDGDIDDHSVVHVHDFETGLTTNLALATTNPLTLSGHRLLFGVSEAAQGGRDLNGDGDVDDDSVVHVHDLETGLTTNLALAARHLRFARSGHHLVFEVSEAAQGGRDLNGDGDVGTDLDQDGTIELWESNYVLHVHDLETGLTTNLALAASGFALSGHRLVFGVSEARQSGRDLNGDGDAQDVVLHVHDLETGETTNLGAATGYRVSGQWVIFTVSEADGGGEDLNGDGDVGTDVNQDGTIEHWESDEVLHVHDLESGTTVNLAMVVVDYTYGLSGDSLVFGVSEERQGGRDLNGDGDAADSVIHVAVLRMPSERLFLRGDCNDDGRVDISDAVCTLNWLFLGWSTPGCVAVTNTNGDTKSDISDAVYLLTHLFLGGPVPVAPYPECGPGKLPADEAMGCEIPPRTCQE